MPRPPFSPAPAPGEGRERIPPTDHPSIEVAIAIVVREDRVLVQRRAEDAHLGGKWEFPGGKIDAGESPEDAGRRELREETGITGGDWRLLERRVHDYGDRRVTLHFFLVREEHRAFESDERAAGLWISLDELPALDMPAANRRLQDTLPEILKTSG